LGAVLLIVAAVFAALTLGRMAGARRRFVARNAAAIIVGAAAILTALRGQALLGIVLGIGAAAFYLWANNRPPPRADARTGPSVNGGAMSDSQARAILGVAPGASETEIRAAFRRRIARAHPDRGGSNEEAARLAAARDVLLKR
jgi:hypothetical protein